MSLTHVLAGVALVLLGPSIVVGVLQALFDPNFWVTLISTGAVCLLMMLRWWASWDAKHRRLIRDIGVSRKALIDLRAELTDTRAPR